MGEKLLIDSEREDRSSLRGRIWREQKLLWRIASPAMLSRVSSYGIIVVTQSFIGHVSELELAAYALTQTILLRFVNGILLGMSSATETLCGQAFGAGQYHMMGIYLQRSWIVDFLTATIMLPFFIFATPIFKLLGQEDDISEKSETIALWFIPVLYSFVFSMTIQMFLQAQLKNIIIGWVSALSFCFHIVISWVFVSKLDLGVGGAMGALCLSCWLSVLGQLIYVFGGWCPDTWKGFTKDSFRDILPVVKLSISSGVMLCLELWYSAVLVLIAGYMTDAAVAISAFSICLNITALEFMIALGFLGASSVRVSNELGRGRPKAAKFAIVVNLSTSVFVGVIFWILCLIYGGKLAYIFTSSEAVVQAVADLSVFLAFSMLLNSIQPVLTGVAIGAGWQSVVAFINIGCYYIIGVPIGCLLGYVANLEVKGIWIGLMCGVGTQTLGLIYLTWRTNWDDQVVKASERLNKWLLKPSEEPNENDFQA